MSKKIVPVNELKKLVTCHLHTLRKELWDLLDTIPQNFSNVTPIIEMLAEIERLLEWIQRIQP
jgi:hypothetical protein